MNEVYIFIFAKDGKIKAFGAKEANNQHVELIKKGWVHVATIDACTWIEFILNNHQNIDISEYLKEFIPKIETTNKNIING